MADIAAAISILKTGTTMVRRKTWPVGQWLFWESATGQTNITEDIICIQTSQGSYPWTPSALELLATDYEPTTSP
jgi:hypothetical protein